MEERKEGENVVAQVMVPTKDKKLEVDQEVNGEIVSVNQEELDREHLEVDSGKGEALENGVPPTKTRGDREEALGNGVPPTKTSSDREEEKEI